MEGPISFWGYKEKESKLILPEHDDDDDDYYYYYYYHFFKSCMRKWLSITQFGVPIFYIHSYGVW